MNNNRIYNIPNPQWTNEPIRKQWAENKFLDKQNGIMDGNLNMQNNKITHLATPTDNSDGVNKSYVDTKLGTKANSATLGNYLKKDGSVAMTGDLNLNNKKKLTYRLDMT